MSEPGPPDAFGVERIEAVLRHARDVVLEVAADGSLTWVSPAVEEMLGYEASVLVGTGVFELVHPDDLEPALHQVAGTLNGESAADGGALVRLRRADDTWVPVEVLGTLLDRDDGSVVVMSLRDITPRIEAEDALRRSEERFQALSEESSDVAMVIDRASRITWASPAFEHLFGYPADDLVGTNGNRYVHPDDIGPLAAAFDDAYYDDLGARISVELRIRARDGTWRMVEMTAANRLGDPRVEGVVLHLRDVTDEHAARREGERLTHLFEATRDIVGIVDTQGDVLYANRAAREFFGGADHDRHAGRSLPSILAPELVARLGEIRADLERDGVWSGELEVTGHGVTAPMAVQLLVHRDDQGEIEFYSGVLHDISERKHFESELAHQASHDPLTLLPNRLLLLDRLEEALDRARRTRSRVAVLFLDLDHFKVVNDSLGHELGDRVLVAIAERLRRAVRPGDTVARFGGDEFVVLCEDLDDHDDARAIASRVDEAISGAFPVDEHEVFVGVSIGIAFADQREAEPTSLIRDADAAMYRAKERGRGRHVVFDHALRANAVERLSTESALRRALDRHELRLHYQPVVDLGSGRVRGVEALMRWEHHERGLLLPGEFMAVAEETGLIVPFGAWVLEHGCREVQRWETSLDGSAPQVLSVNLSGRQLNDRRLVDTVRSALEASGLAPERLELEITESVLMDDVAASGELLRRLKSELGVTIAVDDFGTGYSSLSYLRRFPVDVLKVDQSFVAGMDSADGSDLAIVAAVVNLAHTLGLVALAEGVETPAQLARLRELGCDLAQGFHISRPVGGEAVVELVSSSPTW